MIVYEKERNEIKEAIIDQTNCVLIPIFAYLLCIGLPAILYTKKLVPIIIVLILFLAGLITWYLTALKKIKKHFMVKKYGKLVRAKVVDYYDDNYSIYDSPSQVIKLSLLNDKEGKIIFYQTDTNRKDYEIGSEIELYVYKNLYLINDKKAKRRQKIIAIINILMYALLFINIFVVITIYYIFNTTFYRIKMDHIQNDNKEIMTTARDLEYNIPSDYKLTSYSKDHNYSFESKNEKHHCTIDIYLVDSRETDENINTCNYIDINYNNVNDEEKIINGSKWCYQASGDGIHEQYYINDGKYQYYIHLYKYNDRDEKCTIDFQNFMETVRRK